MNTVKFSDFRAIAIALLLMIGVVTTVATGGGGDGGFSSGNTPPADSDPLLAITLDNGDDVSSTVVIAIGASFDIGDISGEDLIAEAAGNTLYLSGLKNLGALYTEFGNPIAQAMEGCANGGTVDITLTIADPNGPTIGDNIIAVFDNCDDNLGYIISGTVDLTIAALQGDLDTDVFLVGFDIVLTDVTIAEDGESVESSGMFTLTLDSLGFPVMTMSLVGEELQFTADGYTITLADFDHSLTIDSGVVPDTKVAEAFGRLNSVLLGGSVDYDSTTPVHALGDFDPHTGVILITGANDSSVRIIVVDDTRVTLEIDVDGDGVIDGYVETSWAELNQQTSSNGEISHVNSSTAPIIAREVFNAVTGFGSVTVAGGSQFGSTGVFGLIKQQSIAGDFGPLTIDCVVAGTADVSGSIATAGTFGTNDQLSANFLGCARSNEVLDGQMDVTVDSFVEMVGGAYHLTATIVETEFRRFAGGSCFTGSGTFSTSHELTDSSGEVSVDSSAQAFSTSAGGRTQELSVALVNGQITVRQQLSTVTRTSSGRVSSEDLVGSFDYESIVPDVFEFDDDVTAGPYSGELLVTADDNSTLRMVALDQYDVRLDIDFDADSTIDEQIMTTWAQLGYGNTWNLCEM